MPSNRLTGKPRQVKMTDRTDSLVFIPNNSTSEEGMDTPSSPQGYGEGGGWVGYLGGRSSTRGSPSPGGAGRNPTTRRHDVVTARIVASPSASTKHIRGAPASVQSGHGIPAIPAPMPTGTTSSKRTSSTTTSTIAARRITPTVPPAPSAGLEPGRLRKDVRVLSGGSSGNHGAAPKLLTRASRVRRRCPPRC